LGVNWFGLFLFSCSVDLSSPPPNHPPHPPPTPQTPPPPPPPKTPPGWSRFFSLLFVSFRRVALGPFPLWLVFGWFFPGISGGLPRAWFFFGFCPGFFSPGSGPLLFVLSCGGLCLSFRPFYETPFIFPLLSNLFTHPFPDCEFPTNFCCHQARGKCRPSLTGALGSFPVALGPLCLRIFLGGLLTRDPFYLKLSFTLFFYGFRLVLRPGLRIFYPLPSQLFFRNLPPPTGFLQLEVSTATELEVFALLFPSPSSILVPFGQTGLLAFEPPSSPS